MKLFRRARALVMLGLLGSLGLVMATETEKMIASFTNAAAATNWQVVNDDVMGGVSRSRFVITNGVGIFRGTVSLENNGGFASVRTLPTAPELAGCTAFVVRLRGDGQRYKFTVRAADDFSGANYQLAFATERGAWQEVRLPFADFIPTYRGRVLTGTPPLTPGRVGSVGFLISDKQAGEFQLEVEWIKAVKL